jgi:hypothetical protein
MQKVECLHATPPLLLSQLQVSLNHNSSLATTQTAQDDHHAGAKH